MNYKEIKSKDGLLRFILINITEYKWIYFAENK